MGGVIASSNGEVLVWAPLKLGGRIVGFLTAKKVFLGAVNVRDYGFCKRPAWNVMLFRPPSVQVVCAPGISAPVVQFAPNGW